VTIRATPTRNLSSLLISRTQQRVRSGVLSASKAGSRLRRKRNRSRKRPSRKNPNLLNRSPRRRSTEEVRNPESCRGTACRSRLFGVQANTQGGQAVPLHPRNSVGFPWYRQDGAPDTKAHRCLYRQGRVCKTSGGRGCWLKSNCPAYRSRWCPGRLITSNPNQQSVSSGPLRGTLE